MLLLEVAPNIDPEVVRPGLSALLIVVGLLVVVAFLGWSMLRHMRRIQVPYADEVKSAESGVKAWADDMRAKSPDQGEDGPVDATTKTETTTG